MPPRKNPDPPPSLLDLFRCPAGYRGLFGWIAGFSATADFLGPAVEAFTETTPSQRARAGQVQIVLFADPGNPRISIGEVPGLAHCGVVNLAELPFRLMHAKIALLGFLDTENPGTWMVRAIVSTGNWTRETIEESLDLAWSVDIYAADLERPEQPVRQGCADIAAVHEIFVWLSRYYETSLLEVSGPERRNATEIAITRCSEWLGQLRTSAGRQKPRVFDNREASLLEQLPVLVSKFCGYEKRNYLCMGSGFFEGTAAGANSRVPTVLRSVVETLKGQAGKNQYLSSGPEVDIVVNVTACQGVSTQFEAIRNAGWSIRAATPPEYMGPDQRSLHAKFIFSAKYLEGSDRCSSAWLYLGSGNLTGPGFTSKISRNGGNFEVGVVLPVDGVTWSTLGHFLPIDFDNDPIESSTALAAGGDMPVRPPPFIAPPLPLLYAEEVDGELWLRPAKEPSVAVIVLNGATICTLSERGYHWIDRPPREVTISWKDQEAGATCTAVIPIVDACGRIGAEKQLDHGNLSDAWGRLADFPMLPADDQDTEAGRTETRGAKPGPASAETETTLYIRSLMELVEQVARKQTLLEPPDWELWCNRLEESLIDVASSEAVKAACLLGLNPLSPLQAAPFRPTFAEDSTTAHGQRYEHALTLIANKWGVDHLPSIGT